MRKHLVIAATVLSFAAVKAPALAQTEQQALVEKAKITIDDLIGDPNFKPSIQSNMKGARGVLIFPNLLKGAFIFGAEGGRGVLMTRGSDGRWSDPAFYVIGSASFGFQIGGKTTEALLIINTQGGLEKIMNASVKLGGDLSVAAGPVGAGAQAATTTNLGADIFQYAKSEGAFAGLNLDGSVISSNDEWNQAYYNSPSVKPSQIVIQHSFRNKGADALRAELARYD